WDKPHVALRNREKWFQVGFSIVIPSLPARKGKGRGPCAKGAFAGSFRERPLGFRRQNPPLSACPCTHGSTSIPAFHGAGDGNSRCHDFQLRRVPPFLSHRDPVVLSRAASAAVASSAHRQLLVLHGLRSRLYPDTRHHHRRGLRGGDMAGAGPWFPAEGDPVGKPHRNGDDPVRVQV